MSSHLPAGDRGTGGPPPPATPPPDAPVPRPTDPRPSSPGPRERPAASDRADRRVPSTRRRVEAKLSSRTQLQDAFLLYEVLGPPVSLREPGSGPSAG